MLISHDPKYLSARSSVTYWKRQLREAPTEDRIEEAIGKIEEWGKVLEGYRSHRRFKGRMPGAIGRKNPLYMPPAKMPKRRKEDIQRERKEWKPLPLNWD